MFLEANVHIVIEQQFGAYQFGKHKAKHKASRFVKAELLLS